MIRVNVSIENVPADFSQRTERAIRSIIDRISALGQRVAKARAPRDTGQLINSIHTIREFRSPIFVGGIETNLPVAIVMEEGRKPGSFPPLEPIIAWVRRHRASFNIKSGKGSKARIRGVAFVIARKIQKRGIPSNPRFDKRFFFRKAGKAMELKFKSQIDALGLQIQQAWESGGTA